MQGRTIRLNDAVKFAAPPGYSLMFKPVGSKCNLSCTYCYYSTAEKHTLKSENSLTDSEFLEFSIKSYIEGISSERVQFVWHGGEPLLAGIEFYMRVLEYQKRYSSGRIIENSIQTNGTLLNKQWADFFASNNFLVGISMDGPQLLHDKYRVSISGEGSFYRVLRGLDFLKSAGVEFNSLSVITNESTQNGAEIYDFLKNCGIEYMQFLPAVDFIMRLDGGYTPAPWSVTPEGYGTFLSDIFELWYNGDIGKVFIQSFETVLGCYMGMPASLCSFADTCGDALVVEKDGAVYSCDHYVNRDYYLGNIKDKSPLRMVSGEFQRDFGVAKRDTLPLECFNCEYYFACKGGCRKHRIPVSDTSNTGKYYLCEGQKLFLSKCGTRFEKLALELRAV